MKTSFWARIKKSELSSYLIGIVSILAIALLALATVGAATASANGTPRTAQQENRNKELTIQSSSAFVVGTNVLNVSFSTNATSGEVKFEVLRSSNTRSQLFAFAQELNTDRVVSTFTQDLNTISFDSQTNTYTASIPVNSPEAGGLSIASTGVYPLAITLNNETGPQYTFFTYVPSVNEQGFAFAAKLQVAPVIEFSPLVNRFELFTAKNALTEAGENIKQKFIKAKNSFAAISAQTQPASFVLSPEMIELSEIFDRSSSSQEEISGIIPTERNPSIQYFAEPYVPTNFSELSKSGYLNGFDQLIERGSQIIEEGGYESANRSTLFTQAISYSDLSALRERGIDRVIVEDRSFPSNARPTFGPVKFEENGEEVSVAQSDTSIIDSLPDNISSSAKANYLISALSVVALETPSISRGFILPIDLDLLDSVALAQFFASTSGNPLLDTITIGSYFNDFEANSQLSQRLSRIEFSNNTQSTFNNETLESINRYSRATSSMFQENSAIYLNAQWASFVALSPKDRDVNSFLDVAFAQETPKRVLDYIALPQSRTLTLTSRESTLPVTLKNTSGAPIKVVVQVATDRLAFPEGSSVEVELIEENTTVQIPVIARTSGAFPITISISTPEEDIEIIRTTATVRSTAYSGVGLAIAAFSLLFLGIWWLSHHRKSKKKPVAPIVSLKNEK